MYKLKKIFVPTFFRFIIVGCINTLVGYGVMFGLYNLAGLHTWGDRGYWISSAANYVVGSIVSYVLNKHFTFRNREKGAGVVVRFILNITVCYLLAYGLARPAVNIMDPHLKLEYWGLSRLPRRMEPYLEKAMYREQKKMPRPMIR